MKINTIKKLKDALKEQQISQTAFLRQYYLAEIDPNANTESLDLHIERFKKIKDTAAERIVPYGNYFIERYQKDGKYTQADRSAAWEMWIELDTRIATLPLNDSDGIEKKALTSLYQLFQIHRELSKRHGPNCNAYYQLSKKYFDNYIRPFTTHWHKFLCTDNTIEFRNDLIKLQSHLNELKNKLKSIAK